MPQLGEAVFDDYAMLRCSFYYRHVYNLLGRTAFLVPFSGLPDKLAALLSTDPPKTTRTGVRWLRVAFAHLGKLDTVAALEHLIAIANTYAEQEAG
ncbi:hypothetical protein ACQP1O_26320 [Nocardia sp. CA-151230]|uniref:hypothetical protein n=1 Tax=Nocardia sp. CA-151230 TaxID=3239982 RepID=UPI003D9210E8